MEVKWSPDGKRLVFTRHPALWSRKHYRGSYSADLWVADLERKSYTKLLGDEQYNRLWPMWGPEDEIYFVADPLPNERAVKPGSPEARKSFNNIFKVPARGAAQPAQVTKHTSGSLFWPSISSDGKVVGVPTMGAVIGTGSYTLLDGSAIRTPGSGVWTARGENMENFGVQPDVRVDNTPGDFVQGRDAQIEKAVEVLKAAIAAGGKK